MDYAQLSQHAYLVCVDIDSVEHIEIIH